LSSLQRPSRLDKKETGILRLRTQLAIVAIACVVAAVAGWRSGRSRVAPHEPAAPVEKPAQREAGDGYTDLCEMSRQYGLFYFGALFTSNELAAADAREKYLGIIEKLPGKSLKIVLPVSRVSEAAEITLGQIEGWNGRPPSVNPYREGAKFPYRLIVSFSPEKHPFNEYRDWLISQTQPNVEVTGTIEDVIDDMPRTSRARDGVRDRVNVQIRLNGITMRPAAN
jgi:hypothetical protein